MAAFSYQYHQSLSFDHANLPDDTIHMAPAPQQPGDLTNDSSSSLFFPCYYSPDAITEISTNTNDVRTYDSSSSLDTTTRVTTSERNMVRLSEEVQTKQNSVEKKRKNNKQMLLSSSSLSNDPKEGKKRKQKKCGNGLNDVEKSPVADGAEEKKQQQQPPTGYIHVRARRGQATDSHSLAERVRREKISERMKLLQGLVPGCDKVIGKALMLDEIINYVQSLQNQVEFLSMKLASVSPSLFEFGLNLDDYMVHTLKTEGISPPVQHTTHVQHTTFAETTNNYPIVNTSVPFLLHGQGSSVYHQEQDNFGTHVDGQCQSYLQFSNMPSFQ